MIKTKETTLKVLLLSASLLLAPNLKADTIQVTANLTGTTTWYNTNEYVLNGFIYVLAGGVLNIQPDAGPARARKSSPTARVLSRSFSRRNPTI